MGNCFAGTEPVPPPKKQNKKFKLSKEHINDLEQKHITAKDIDDIIENGKKEGYMDNPIIVCVSTKQQQIKLDDDKFNIEMIDGTRHQHIRDTIQQDIVKNKLQIENPKYDGMIIIFVCIVVTNQDGISPKVFFDKAGEFRNMDKLKNDISTRYDDKSVILDHRLCVKLEDIGNGMLRPGHQMEQLVPNGRTYNITIVKKPKKTNTNQPQTANPNDAK
eukprot:34061_1